MTRLRWTKEKKSKAVGAPPPGYLYGDGEKLYAMVSPLGGDWRRGLRGWYWVAGWDSNIPYHNTCRGPLCGTPEEAKQQAARYVAEHSPDEPAKNNPR